MSANHLSPVLTNKINQNQYSGFLNFLRDSDYIIGQDSYCQFINEKKPVLAFDVTFKILFVNDMMQKLLEKEKFAILGQLLHQVLPMCMDSGNENLLSPWGELIRNGLLIGKKYICKVEFTKGQPVVVSMTGSPLFDKSGQLAGGVVFFKQIKKFQENKLSTQI